MDDPSNSKIAELAQELGASDAANRKLCDLLKAALGQWRMYAEQARCKDLADDPSYEGQSYRHAISYLRSISEPRD